MKRGPSWLICSKMKLLYRSILCLTWIFFKLFYRHRIYGREHFCEGAGLIASNHTSFLDPPAIAISWPEEVHFLARDTLFHHFGLGWLIRKLNAHPVKGGAGDVAVFRTIEEVLSEGHKLIMFPEGTRSQDGRLQEIRPGIALLASRTKAALIPTYVYGTFAIWGRGRKLPRLFGKSATIFGSPILWEQFASLPRKEAQSALILRFEEAIKALRSWYEAGAKGSPP